MIFDEIFKPTNRKHQKIRFTNKLRLKDSSSQIFYIELDRRFLNELKRSDLEQIVISNYNKIKELFAKKGYDFIYLPTTINEILNDEVYEYYDPSLINRSNAKSSMRYFFNYDRFYSDFRNYIVPDESEAQILCLNPYGAGFIKITEGWYSNDTYKYEADYIRLDGLTYEELNDCFNLFASTLEKEEQERIWKESQRASSDDDCLLASICLTDFEVEEYDADKEFPTEVRQLTDEIRERVEKLHQLGINDLAIKLLAFHPQSISKIVITKDYKIFLPDYNNMEIQMAPLPKAVYILFLKHPEGIRFKELYLYKKELLKIYLNITNRETYDDIIQSIEDLADSTKNSINEKCSRIREAFVSKFDESLAQYYYINGGRATPKKVYLEREKIIFE